ncbi:phosphoheptose isomerase [Amycolatopsis suaedae]|uniref:Phosphoheptose isomerase n=1 Tax=Amycolatopsis suaedae TaxID=2510978 RepID=A0A4Q7J0B0_9PSEU|nr:phosphoheptose isomerase [Amycolatopsis suaedae]RZQ60217.1 phosphoheptose isomerase [Amycolatopsis suaedae]
MRSSAGVAHLDALESALVALRAQAARLTRWGHLVVERAARGGRLVATGERDTRVDAQHLVDRLGRAGIPAEIGTKVTRRDVLLVLAPDSQSRSGAAAATAARLTGAVVLALTGPGPNPVANAADEAVCLPGTAEQLQESHLVAVHLICEACEQTGRDAA